MVESFRATSVVCRRDNQFDDRSDVVQRHYYATVATVIPVLMALFFFEAWRRPRGVPPMLLSVVPATSIVVLTAAEANALDFLHERAVGSHFQQVMVDGGLIWGFLALFFGVVIERLPITAESLDARGVAVLLLGAAGFASLILLSAGVNMFLALAYAAYAAIFIGPIVVSVHLIRSGRRQLQPSGRPMARPRRSRPTQARSAEQMGPPPGRHAGSIRRQQWQQRHATMQVVAWLRGRFFPCRKAPKRCEQWFTADRSIRDHQERQGHARRRAGLVTC